MSVGSDFLSPWTVTHQVPLYLIQQNAINQTAELFMGIKKQIVLTKSALTKHLPPDGFKLIMHNYLHSYRNLILWSILEAWNLKLH